MLGWLGFFVENLSLLYHFSYNLDAGPGSNGEISSIVFITHVDCSTMTICEGKSIRINLTLIKLNSNTNLSFVFIFAKLMLFYKKQLLTIPNIF